MRLVTCLLCLAALSLSSPAPASGAGGWPWPVSGEVITPYRNGDDPYAAGMHRGIDIAAPAGTRVVAAAGGTVTWAAVAGSSGLTVAIDTGGLVTSYLHLSSVSVERGARVAAGDPLGAVGTSGTRSAAKPHLHFGVREAGTDHGYRDPLDYLRPVAAPPPPERAPEPAPAPALPAPAPAAPAPVAIPITRPSPLPRAVPVRVPGSRPRGVRAPRPQPRSVPSGVPAPRALRVPARRQRLARRRAPARGRSPAPGRGISPRAASPAGDDAPRVPARAAAARPAPPRWPLVAAAAGLLLAASSIGRAWPSSSQRPSTTRTASRISVMRTRPSRPT